MKKKILSAILSGALLIACMSPAALAANTNNVHEHTEECVLDHEHSDACGHDHGIMLTADQTTQEAAYESAWSAVLTLGSVEYTDSHYNVLKNFKEAQDALIASGGAQNDTYNYVYNAFMSDFTELSNSAIKTYKECYDMAKANKTTALYTTYYNATSSAYNRLITTDKATVDSDVNYKFSTLVNPGNGSGSTVTPPSYTTDNIKPIQNATTLAALSSAIATLQGKINTLSTGEQLYLNNAQDVLTFLTNVSTAQATITASSMGTNSTLYSAYLNFNENQLYICNNITDVDTTSFVTAHKIAADYFSLSDPSTSESIVSIYTRYLAFGNPGRYFKVDFQTAIYDAYNSYLTQYNVDISTSFSSLTSKAYIDITISAGFNISAANIKLDIDDVFFTSAWMDGLTIENGTIRSSSYLSGNLEVAISNIVGTRTVLHIVLNIPTTTVGSNLKMTVSGDVTSNNGTDDFATNITLTCCSHRVGGAVVYELKTIKAATCTTGGIQGYFCKLCGSRLTASDGAPSDDIITTTSAHTPGDKVTAGVYNVKPTCTTSGVQYYECSICHSVIQKGVVLPASHKFDATTIYWNESAGAWYAKCSDCGIDYNISVTKNNCSCQSNYNKSFAKVVATKAATCGVKGYIAYECSVCGVTWVESNGEALGSHTWGAWITTVQPTCTTLGVQTRTCSVCNKIETQNIDKLEHKFDTSGYKIVTEATCTSTGLATKSCSYCGATETFIIDKLAHTFDNGVVTKEATCSAPGVKTYTCTVCGTTKTESIAINPDNHNLTTTVEKEANCIENGLEITTCKDCDYKVETVIEKTGHTWRSDESTDKLTKKTCVVCRTTWEQKKTSKATTLSITTNKHFNLLIKDTAIAEKDVVFAINDVALDTSTIDWFDTFFDDGKYDAAYFGAYETIFTINGNEAAFNSNMNVSIDLGTDYKKNEIFVVYITDEGTPSAKVNVKRDGSSIVINGQDFEEFADKTFVVMTSNDKVGTSPIVAILICVAVVAVAGVVVVIVIKNGKGGKKDVPEV